VIKEIAKAHRFGLTDTNPETGETNREAIARELDDLRGVWAMLVRENIIRDAHEDSSVQKAIKVKRWMGYAKKRGAII
jgi:hypothetical protein